MSARATRRPRWSVSGTASAPILRSMLDYARSRGVDTAAILRAIELPASKLRDCDHRITEAARARAWELAAHASGDPAFGLHAGARARFADFDVLGYAVHFSETLGDAFDRIMRFHRVLCDALAMSRTDTKRRARFTRLERTPPADSEATLAFLVKHARELTGKHVSPREVAFAHAAPPKTREYEKLFGCPVRFGAVATYIDVDLAVLDLPIRSANAGIVAILDRYMGKDIAQLPRAPSSVEHARAAIARALREGRRPSLGSTAKSLRASSRTLQRHLGAHGMTHGEIVDAVRKDIAEDLLARGHLSITEVAFLTGFADVSGFRKRYRRWTGRAPSRR